MPDHELHLGLEEDGEGYTTLTLMPNSAKPRGGVVVLDEWLIDQIHLAMDRVEAAPEKGSSSPADRNGSSPRAPTSRNSSPRTTRRSSPTWAKAAAAFMRITHLDCTSAAVIGGSALGGGLEIAMHCDGLIGLETGADEKPYLVGLPEAGLGLCPAGGTQMLPARIRHRMRSWPRPRAGSSRATNSPTTSSTWWSRAGRTCPRPHGTGWDLPEAPPLGTPRSIQDMSTDVLIVALDEIADLLPDTDAARAVVECSGVDKDGFLTALETERRLVSLDTPHHENDSRTSSRARNMIGRIR